MKQSMKDFLGLDPDAIAPFCKIRHTITRYRIQLEVFTAKVNRRPARTPQGHCWVEIEELEKLAFPSAHRKIVGRLKLSQPKRLHLSRATAWKC
jgi:adenine-specific DNA glycosylase